MAKKKTKNKQRKFSHDAFESILLLLSNHPWLNKRAKAVTELMHEFCLCDEETDLLCDLLRRHTHLSQEDFADHLSSIPKHIILKWGLSEDETQIIPTTTDRKPDSGQLVIQSLKPLFVEAGWTKVRMSNRQTAALDLIDERPDVIIVDDFSGTGRTVVNVIQDLRNRIGAKGLPPARSFRVCVVAAMESAIKAIEAVGAQVYVPIRLEKGITDHFTGAQLRESIARMLEIESRLAPSVNGEALPSFGWGGAEALFSIEKQNTPNSVFPVFWWPETVDRKQRRTLLVRMI